MFGPRYFGPRYFGPRYWAVGGDAEPAVVTPTPTGGGWVPPKLVDEPKRRRPQKTEIEDLVRKLMTEAEAPAAELEETPKPKKRRRRRRKRPEDLPPRLAADLNARIAALLATETERLALGWQDTLDALDMALAQAQERERFWLRQAISAADEARAAELERQRRERAKRDEAITLLLAA